MPSYDMNTGMAHESNEVDLVGFPEETTTTTMPTVPYKKSAPLADAIDKTNGTHRLDVGPSAHDITMRSRNG